MIDLTLAVSSQGDSNRTPISQPSAKRGGKPKATRLVGPLDRGVRSGLPGLPQSNSRDRGLSIAKRIGLVA